MAERIMLNINHIAKTFNPGTITEKRALTDVELKLNEGDFVTIIGGNGAGKSTTPWRACSPWIRARLRLRAWT